MQTQFALAVDAANRAATADTDASATEFARQAQAGREQVKRAESELSGLLRDLAYDDEAKLLAEFHGKFAAYEILERGFLELPKEHNSMTRGEKRTMTVTCQESLRDLGEALSARLAKPTR
jgi:hypothetical protein